MADANWEDASRLEAWAGEVRVNLIRSVALILFYANHLLNVYAFKDETITARFHAAATIIVLAWAIGVVVLHVCLTRRWMPPALKFASTGLDVVLVSALLVVSPEGPRSPLIFLYFVIIATTPLRLSLPLVYAATFGAMLAALLVLGYYVYFTVGAATYYDKAKFMQIPRVQEIIFFLSLGASGLLAGQMVRQARRLVKRYPVQVQEEQEAA